MLLMDLPLLGLLLVGSVTLSSALVAGARHGHHRQWSLAMFIAGLALVVGSRIQYGLPILADEMSGFLLTMRAIALASLASSLTIQILRAWRTSTPWQVGAGTVAAETTMLTGVEYLHGC